MSSTHSSSKASNAPAGVAQCQACREGYGAGDEDGHERDSKDGRRQGHNDAFAGAYAHG